MAIHPVTGALWQADNGRDSLHAAIPTLKNDNELPRDELNVVERGAHYGWPYCYDSNVASPEYPAARCAAYRAPVRVLPPHGAPLGMLFYTGKVFPPQFQRSLIVGLHGYRQHGHRIVALMPDKAGAPLGKMVDLVSGWRTGPHSTGAPVDVRQGADGFLYIADDRNGKLLRLQYAAP
jgi:glucose/arabinose dehydrogenase